MTAFKGPADPQRKEEKRRKAEATGSEVVGQLPFASQFRRSFVAVASAVASAVVERMAGQRPSPQPEVAAVAWPLPAEASSLCSSSQSSGALSQFSISRSAVVDSMLETLVGSVSLLDPGSPAFHTALQFCSFHTRSHQYLDVDDVQVGRLYDG